MSGVERLRELGNDYVEHSWSEAGKRRGMLMLDIADQIERELSEERDRWDSELCEAQMDKTRVVAVYLEMNEHVSGVEGADDSPVARWARELRRALKSDANDERDAQNPSCTGTAEAADVTFEAQKVTRGPAEDVSMSAYDLLPAYEREAIAWVREHGGLDGVKKLLDWVVGHCSTEQQLDFDFWLSGRVMRELGFEEDMADRDEVERRLLARLMPEGMEWPTVDGKPVDFKTGYEPSLGVLEAVSIYSNGACEVMGHDGIIKDVKEIHVVSPKVDADGVPIYEGDTVYDKDTGDRFEVDGFSYDCVVCTDVDACESDIEILPSQLTHAKPEPDSWSSVWADVSDGHETPEGMMRRCRALAERERGER